MLLRRNKIIAFQYIILLTVAVVVPPVVPRYTPDEFWNILSALIKQIDYLDRAYNDPMVGYWNIFSVMYMAAAKGILQAVVDQERLKKMSVWGTEDPDIIKHLVKRLGVLIEKYTKKSLKWERLFIPSDEDYSTKMPRLLELLDDKIWNKKIIFNIPLRQFKPLNDMTYDRLEYMVYKTPSLPNRFTNYFCLSQIISYGKPYDSTGERPRNPHDCKLDTHPRCENLYYESERTYGYGNIYKIQYWTLVDVHHCKPFSLQPNLKRRLCERMLSENLTYEELDPDIPLLFRDIFAMNMFYCAFNENAEFFNEKWMELVAKWIHEHDGCVQTNIYPSYIVERYPTYEQPMLPPRRMFDDGCTDDLSGTMTALLSLMIRYLLQSDGGLTSVLNYNLQKEKE